MIIGVDSASVRWHAMAWAPAYERWLPSQVVTKSGSRDDRRQRLAEGFDAMLAAATVLSTDVHVFFEYPLSLQNPDTNIALSMAAGALWDRHLKYDLWWHWVQINHWQTWIGCSGKDKSAERKAKAKAFAIERGVADDLEEDHYDAACVQLWGQSELDRLPDAWRPGCPA